MNRVARSMNAVSQVKEIVIDQAVVSRESDTLKDTIDTFMMSVQKTDAKEKSTESVEKDTIEIESRRMTADMVNQDIEIDKAVSPVFEGVLERGAEKLGISVDARETLGMSEMNIARVEMGTMSQAELNDKLSLNIDLSNIKTQKHLHRYFGAT